MTNFLASILKKLASWLEGPPPQGGGLELEKEGIPSPPTPEKSIEVVLDTTPTVIPEEDAPAPQVVGEILPPLPQTPLERPKDIPLKKKGASVVVQEQSPPKDKETKGTDVVTSNTTEFMIYPDSMSRDISDIMEFPFLALSKNRIKPLVCESDDKTHKIIISAHRGHFLASIYDWDILVVVAGKLQEVLNKSEIPSQTVVMPRHELLKALHKRDGRKERKDLEKSLQRLQLSGIETTVNNKDMRHKAGFGFITGWGYKERKNDREMRHISITLSPWLHELCCGKGSLLKPNREYFEITSGLQKFLYRTARKHAGMNKDGWWLSIEDLHKKSGSGGSLRLFKNKLKTAVMKSKIPDYSMEWQEKKGVQGVLFKRSPLHELTRLAEKYGENMENYNEIKELNEED